MCNLHRSGPASLYVNDDMTLSSNDKIMLSYYGDNHKPHAEYAVIMTACRVLSKIFCLGGS